MSDTPEIDWLQAVALMSVINRVTARWAQLVDADGLRETPPMKLMPWSAGAEERLRLGGYDPVRVGLVNFLPGTGDQLLAHLREQFVKQLGLTADDIFIEMGFYLEPA